MKFHFYRILIILTVIQLINYSIKILYEIGIEIKKSILNNFDNKFVCRLINNGNMETKSKISKEEEFKLILKSIENEYIDYFMNTKSLFYEIEDRNFLHNHWELIFEDGKVIFSFREGTDLPENIKKECIRAFNKVFG